MNPFESNNLGQALMEEEKTEKNLDEIPYEDFIFQVEEEILSEERNKNNNNVNYLTACLEDVKARKENFLNKMENEDRRLTAKVLFEIKEVVLKNLIEARKGNRSEEFRVGDSKWQQEIIFLINKIKDKPKELQMFWDEYKALFDYEEDTENGNKYMAGILAPLALQNILEEKYGFEIHYPKPEEDVKYSIDMIAEDPDKKSNFLIQVKTNREEIEKMIKRDLEKIRRPNKDGKTADQKEESGKEFIKVIPRFEFGNVDKKMDKNYQTFSKGCAKFMEKSERSFESDPKTTRGVYLYVPYVLNGDRLVDLTGNPKEKVWEVLVGEGLESKLDLPKRFNYDTILGK
ncbi:hypothetical protein C4572_01660 [Candidatus Parcubacteria bacterium]|nr:MAG: hypothetical protein C4572_01660 [Candidatus Parcubacteria bacterium]